MSIDGFTLDQLMELAGLSVSQAGERVIQEKKGKKKKNGGSKEMFW